MLNPMINRLIRKDLYFNRSAIIGYTLAAFVAVGLIGSNRAWATNFGSIGLIMVVIAMGFHMIVQTVVSERTEHTLPFVMSLPISPRQYTVAKLIANLVTFIVPWLIIVVAAVSMILVRSSLPNGLTLYTLIILGELLVSYCLYLSVAIITESLVWTGAAVVVGNLLLQGFMQFVSNIPSIAQSSRSETITWSPAVFGLLLGELIAIVVLLAITLYIQSKKKDFL